MGACVSRALALWPSSLSQRSVSVEPDWPRARSPLRPCACLLPRPQAAIPCAPTGAATPPTTGGAGRAYELSTSLALSDSHASVGDTTTSMAAAAVAAVALGERGACKGPRPVRAPSGRLAPPPLVSLPPVRCLCAEVC